MAYSDATVVRAEQEDQGAGVDNLRAKTRNSKVYQVTMPNDVDGTFASSGGSLVEALVCTAAAGAVYEVRGSMDGYTGTYVWLCVVDTDTEPSGGETIVDAVALYEGGTSGISYPGGLPLTTGLSLCLSTTLGTVTLPGESVARLTWNADVLG